MFGVSVGGQGPVSVSLSRDDFLAKNLAPAGQNRIRLDHATGQVEDDGCLFPVRGGGDNFSALFAIGEQKGQGDARGQRGFAVLSWNLDVCRPVSAKAIGAQRPEQRKNDVLILPFGQSEWFAGADSLNMAETMLEEQPDVFGLQPPNSRRIGFSAAC